MTHDNGIETLAPKDVWRIFAGVSTVPRPSKHEERIRAHLRTVIEKQGLTVQEDATGNLVIPVPASAGCESAPIAVLQAHVDMVCEKNSDVKHDFDNDPIRLILDSDGDEKIVRADGTTLGADNGMGVALALAAAFSKDIPHGPLEILLTVDEEAGMTGAKALKPDSFRGRVLLNLDSEEDTSLCIGCAGGNDTTLTWRFPIGGATDAAEVCRVSVTGLRGGHSGCDIHENRGSAIKLLMRTIAHAKLDACQLADVNGGSKRNAIPREASALVAGKTGLMAALRAAADALVAEARLESAEPGLKIAIETAQPVDEFFSVADSHRLIESMIALPQGVLGMSPKVPDLVQTSNNIATIFTTREGSSAAIAVGMLTRSSSAYWIQDALERIAAIGRLASAEIATGNAYPGWDPDPDAAIVGTCRRVYEQLFGAPPEVSAIHAGLECGIIGKRVGKMDMVSFGPRIEGAHSPDERVYVASVQKIWNYLKAVLEALSRA